MLVPKIYRSIARSIKVCRIAAVIGPEMTSLVNLPLEWQWKDWLQGRGVLDRR